MRSLPYPECPDDSRLQSLAANTCPQDLVPETLRHVSACDYCGPQLQRYVEEFSDEAVPEDAAILHNLQSSGAKWQRATLRAALPDLKRGQASPGRTLSMDFSWLRAGFWPKTAALAGGLALVATGFFAGSALLANRDLHQEQSRIATAFSENQVTPMRLTGVRSPYQPSTVERGTAGAVEHESSSLLDAKRFAPRNNAVIPSDSSWLQVQGRVDLLEHDPQQAEKDLGAALEKERSVGHVNSGLEIDLAASYFEQAMGAKALNPAGITSHPDMRRTIELLTSVLHRSNLTHEETASAQFNLALALETSEQWIEAAAAWQQYLKVDTNGEWLQVARDHLQQVQSHMNQRGRNEKIQPPVAFYTSKDSRWIRPHA